MYTPNWRENGGNEADKTANFETWLSRLAAPTGQQKKLKKWPQKFLMQSPPFEKTEVGKWRIRFGRGSVHGFRRGCFWPRPFASRPPSEGTYLPSSGPSAVRGPRAPEAHSSGGSEHRRPGAPKARSCLGATKAWSWLEAPGAQRSTASVVRASQPRRPRAPKARSCVGATKAWSWLEGPGVQRSAASRVRPSQPQRPRASD